VTVVNIRHEPYDVYIGRAGHGHDGRWGNPFRLIPGQDRGATIDRYRVWLWQQIQLGRITVEELAQLHGKTLGCFCKPEPCHGDVLAAAAAWAAQQ